MMLKKLLLSAIIFLGAAPCWGVTASDNFNRANAGTLGANWSNASGVSQPLQVVSNQAANNGGIFAVEVWTADSFTSNQFSKATFVVVGNSRMTVIVRAAVATNDLYGCGFNNNFDATHYTLFKVVSGSQSQIGSTSATTVTNNDVVELDVSGTRLTCIVNGSVIFSQTDVSLSGNAPGVQANDGSSAARFDDWSGGDFVAPPTGGIGGTAGVGGKAGIGYWQPVWRRREQIQ